ncbi:MAG: hypothetical protein Q4D81_13070 [Eubacteriales bacterium]|nr:hypothetical protein [Eubacteriales bacterium]
MNTSTSVKEFVLDESALEAIDERMTALENEGAVVPEEKSGELNFSGCHKGYCQAWD